MKRDLVDFHLVPEHHLGIDAKLQEWARWVKVRPAGWHMSPMFREYRSKAWQWHAPEVRTPVNTLQALEIERAVSSLPEKNRSAIRWHYCFPSNPRGMARKLAVSMDGLADLVRVARAMLINRGCG